MFGANLTSYPYISPVNTYGENLGKAARSFVAALLAIEPSKIAAAPAEAPLTEQSKADAVNELNLLAQHFDAVMPNQAAELRYLAGCDVE